MTTDSLQEAESPADSRKWTRQVLYSAMLIAVIPIALKGSWWLALPVALFAGVLGTNLNGSVELPANRAATGGPGIRSLFRQFPIAAATSLAVGITGIALVGVFVF